MGMSLGRILIVDDDPQIRRVMKMTLTGEGYEVGEARSGEEAQLELRRNPYDLMLLDLNTDSETLPAYPPSGVMPLPGRLIWVSILWP